MVRTKHLLSIITEMFTSFINISLLSSHYYFDEYIIALKIVGERKILLTFSFFRSSKSHPGPVVHISDNPMDEGKVEFFLKKIYLLTKCMNFGIF